MLRHDNGSALAGGSLLQFPIGRAGAAVPVVGEPELVLVRAIQFQSLCESHLLPYYGAVHIGYVHGENQLSTAEFTRIIEACSGGLQDQQRMTTRMGLWLQHQLAPRGVGVLVEGGYTCATAHGGTPFGGPSTTLAFYGSMRHSADEQREFLALARQELRKGHSGDE
jgi:GTP cyclohydrolase I